VDVPVVLAAGVGEDQVDIIADAGDVEIVDSARLQAVSEPLLALPHHERMRSGVTAD